MTTPQTPNFLFCGGQDIAGQLVDEANRHLLGTSYAYKPSTLDHFIFFYQETPGLALSDFAIAQFAAERLAEIESNPESTEPTRYSHKLGRRMFDTQAILDTARQWVRDTQALVEDLFQKVDGKPCLAYTGADGLGAEVYVEDGASLRQFIRERGLDGLLRLLADGMAKVGKPELLKRMDERRLKAQKREEREALAQRHHEILKTVFPSQP